MLAIFVPIGYVTGWLIASRIVYMMMDHLDDVFEGVMAMLCGLLWPVLVVLFPAWLFVTWPTLKKQRAAERGRLEREKEWEGRRKTAELEREIYGTALRKASEW